MPELSCDFNDIQEGRFIDLIPEEAETLSVGDIVLLVDYDGSWAPGTFIGPSPNGLLVRFNVDVNNFVNGVDI